MSVLSERLKNLQPHAQDHFYLLSFGYNNFLNPETDQLLIIYYGIDGDKHQFSDIFDFAIRTLLDYCETVYKTDEEFKQLALHSQNAPLSMSEYQGKLAELHGQLKAEIRDFPLIEGNYLRGVKLFDLPNFVAFVCETDAHYYAFYWEASNNL